MVIRGKANEVTLAYLAGIVDGEGHISIDRSKPNIQRRVSPRYQPEFVVVNTDRKLIDWLVLNFGGSVYTRKILKTNWKQSWTWKLGNQQAAEMCRQLIPYLMLKKEQAILLVDFMDNISPRVFGKGSKLSDEELNRRDSIYEQMRKLTDSRHPQRLTEEATKVDVIV
jgi:hypothetical protein